MPKRRTRQPITISAPGATIRVEMRTSKPRDADRLLRVAIAAWLRSERTGKPAA